MLAKPQGFPRKLGGCAGLDPRLRSAVSAGVGDGERGLRRGLRAPGVGVRPKWVLEYSPSNKRIRYFVSITYVRTGLWTAHKFCGGGRKIWHCPLPLSSGSITGARHRSPAPAQLTVSLTTSSMVVRWSRTLIRPLRRNVIMPFSMASRFKSITDPPRIIDSRISSVISITS